MKTVVAGAVGANCSEANLTHCAPPPRAPQDIGPPKVRKGNGCVAPAVQGLKSGMTFNCFTNTHLRQMHATQELPLSSAVAWCTVVLIVYLALAALPSNEATCHILPCAPLCRPRDTLASKFGVSSLPTVIMLRPDGSIITKDGYQTICKDPTGYGLLNGSHSKKTKKCPGCTVQ